MALPLTLLRGGGVGARLLALSVAIEVVSTTCMKLASIGSPWWLLCTYAGYAIDFALFPLVLKQMPLGTAYAIWSGLGLTFTAIVSRVFFGEALGTKKIVSLALVVAGVIGLNLAD